MKRIILLFAVIISTACASTICAQRLFHISRSVNRNLVCYDVNQKSNVLDMKNPIHVYWHNRTDNPGHENELSYIQRKMAYGYNILSKGNNEVEVKLTAYKKRAMTVCRHKGKWISKIIINGKPSQLTEIQVKTKEGNSLNVLYVTLVGKALADGTPQTERIYNK